jgi:hypothetical protein
MAVQPEWMEATEAVNAGRVSAGPAFPRRIDREPGRDGAEASRRYFSRVPEFHLEPEFGGLTAENAWNAKRAEGETMCTDSVIGEEGKRETAFWIGKRGGRTPLRAEALRLPEHCAIFARAHLE